MPTQWTPREICGCIFEQVPGPGPRGVVFVGLVRGCPDHAGKPPAQMYDDVYTENERLSGARAIALVQNALLTHDRVRHFFDAQRVLHLQFRIAIPAAGLAGIQNVINASFGPNLIIVEPGLAPP